MNEGLPFFQLGGRKLGALGVFWGLSRVTLMFFLPFWGVLSVALASGGSLPITSLDATGNLVFANAGGAPNIVTAPLFLNPQNLSLLTSNPVSLVSAAAGSSGPVASLHASSTSTESMQNSLFTVASASGAASTTTTASKAQ